jgi:Skp family chaperone for outer membrane proteins
MNNKVILGVIGVWLIALTYLQLVPTPAKISDEGAAVIAFVHGDTLRQGMLLIQTLEASLRKSMNEVDSTLKVQALPLQQEAQELIQYANSAQATENEIGIASKRVREIETILEKMQYEAEQHFLFQESTMQATIAAHLTKTLRTYSEKNGIDVVLNWGLSGEGVLFGTDARDVTSEVLQDLNFSN